MTRAKKHGTIQELDVILTGDNLSPDTKIAAIGMGIEEFLPSPVTEDALVGKVGLLARRHRRHLLASGLTTPTDFEGTLRAFPLPDLLRTLTEGRHAAVVTLNRGTAFSGHVYFRDGDVVDAEIGLHQGRGALERLSLWEDGGFDVSFRPVRRPDTISEPPDVLLTDISKCRSAWAERSFDLAPLTEPHVLDQEKLGPKLSRAPADLAGVFRMFDGRNTLQDVVDQAGLPPFDVLDVAKKLYEEGLLKPAVSDASPRPDPTGSALHRITMWLEEEAPGQEDAPAKASASLVENEPTVSQAEPDSRSGNRDQGHPAQMAATAFETEALGSVSSEAAVASADTETPIEVGPEGQPNGRNPESSGLHPEENPETAKDGPEEAEPATQASLDASPAQAEEPAGQDAVSRGQLTADHVLDGVRKAGAAAAAVAEAASEEESEEATEEATEEAEEDFESDGSPTPEPPVEGRAPRAPLLDPAPVENTLPLGMKEGAGVLGGTPLPQIPTDGAAFGEPGGPDPVEEWPTRGVSSGKTEKSHSGPEPDGAVQPVDDGAVTGRAVSKAAPPEEMANTGVTDDDSPLSAPSDEPPKASVPENNPTAPGMTARTNQGRTTRSKPQMPLMNGKSRGVHRW